MIFIEKNKLTQISSKCVQQIVSAITKHSKGRTQPYVVSIDGGSGAGKSTLASEVALQLGATIIQCDDFFSATITDDDWDSYSLEKKCYRCIDLKRLRNEALLPLIAGKIAQYHPFSFSSNDGLSTKTIKKKPSKIIILDGIYTSLPALSDVVDFKVLVNVLPDVRRNRHNLREGTTDEAWHLRWDSAEDYYFSVLCPPTSFDLVVFN